MKFIFFVTLRKFSFIYIKFLKMRVWIIAFLLFIVEMIWCFCDLHVLLFLNKFEINCIFFQSFFDIPSSAAHIQGQASPSSSLMSDYSSGSEGDVQQIIQKYEEGSRGILNPVFSSLLIKWFDFCHEIGLYTDYVVDQKLINIVLNLL